MIECTEKHILNKEHSSPICSLYMTQKGSYLLAASVQKRFTIHNAQTGRCIAQYPLFAQPSQIQASTNNELIHVSQANKHTVMSVRDGERIVEFSSPNSTFHQPIMSMYAMEQIVICGSKDGKVHIYDLLSRNRSPIMMLDDGKDSITGVHYNEATCTIVTCCLDGSIRQYDTRNGKLVIDSISNSIGSMTMCHNSNSALLSPLNSPFQYVDLKNGQVLGEYTNVEFNNENQLKITTAILNDQYFFAGDGVHKGIWYWDIVQENKHHQFIPSVTSLNCCCSNGDLVAGGGINGTIVVWQCSC
jgi:WD40 repeat protein